MFFLKILTVSLGFIFSCRSILQIYFNAYCHQGGLPLPGWNSQCMVSDFVRVIVLDAVDHRWVSFEVFVRLCNVCKVQWCYMDCWNLDWLLYRFVSTLSGIFNSYIITCITTFFPVTYYLNIILILIVFLSIYLPIMSNSCWGPRHMRIKLQEY